MSDYAQPARKRPNRGVAQGTASKALPASRIDPEADSLKRVLSRAPSVQAVARSGRILNGGPRASKLAAVAGTLQRSTPAVVQRFPANVYTNAYNWSAGNFQVAPLGGGTMAALFKLTENVPVGGAINSVVVKALEVDEPDSIRLGETFLRQMGMALPDDRIIMPGSPEFTALATRLGFQQNLQGHFVVNRKVVGGLLLMQDLSAAGATTMQSKLMQATTRADIDDVFTWMTDPVVLDAVGKAIVYDAAIGNFDRITMDAQNFGNLMISRGGAAATRVFLIDTNARLPRIQREILEQAHTHGAFYEERVMRSTLLKGIFDHRDWAIDNWFDAIPSMIHAQQQLREDAGGQRNAFLDQEGGYIAAKVTTAKTASAPAIQAAFDMAMNGLRAMISNKGDVRRQAIKAAAGGTQSFDTLKANVGYLEQRTRPSPGPGQVGPLAHDAAAGIVETYGRYKVAKATAGVPVNLAANPTVVAGPALPKSLRAGSAKELLKGDKFKARQATDWNAFWPSYQTFGTNVTHHIEHLKQMKDLLDNAVKLRRSLAGPAETRNQRAMISHQKRTGEFTRQQNLLAQPARDAMVYSAEYDRQAASVMADMNKASDRYTTLREIHAPALLAKMQQVTALTADVQRLYNHLTA